MVALEEVGRKIRRERNLRHLTLDQLAKMTALSKSFISQIERGLAHPSVSTLQKISAQLGIHVVQLFGEAPDSHPNSEGAPPCAYRRLGLSSYVNETKIVRSGRRKGLKLPGSSITYELLTPDLNRQMEALFVRAAPGEHTGNEPLVNSTGEKFGFVLRGGLEVQVGNETFDLQQGDTIYHSAGIPHSWRCIGNEPVEIIWIMTPPSF